MEFGEATTLEESRLGEGRPSWELKNGKAAGEAEVTEEMIKGGGNRVVDWIWRLCNMAFFESGVVPEDWRSVIASLYKSKGERNECKNYIGISLLSMFGEIYAGILRNRVCGMTGSLIDDEKGYFGI